VTFQAKLGSLGDKSHRISTLAQQIAGLCGFNVSLAVRCAELAKCDLLTSVVGEFPELQGVMGAYYAAADGEPREVAHGIREHYLPRGAGDALPTTEAGIAVALADRLDTLAGIFAISEKPTGTKDPFGLRRAAIGIVRILTERGLDLDLRALVDAAVAAQPVKRSAVAGEVLAYITERLRAYYLDGLAPAHPAGVVTTEQIEAVLAAAPRSLVDFGARLAALSCFLARPEAESLAAAHKRIANILRKAGAEPPSAVDESALREPAERALHAALVQGREEVGRAVAAREYDRALDRLATLRPEVDAFFDAVMVMDPDPVLRANRLALLVALRGEFAAIADLSCLPGR
jgi:glycyl-tRNA synthetase beta chain